MATQTNIYKSAQQHVYHSYSGTDIKIYAALNQSYLRELSETTKTNNTTMPNDIIFKELGELQTISYSGYREKEAVVALGSSAPRGFTRGIHTIAGTAIFTVIHRRALHELFDAYLTLGFTDDATNRGLDMNTLRIDQLPPLDLFVSFENEYGDRSRLSIYGVEFMNEGQVMSINDLMTESSVNYLARYVLPMRSVDGKDDSIPYGDLWNKNDIEKSNTNIAFEYAIAKDTIDAARRMFL